MYTEEVVAVLWFTGMCAEAEFEVSVLAIFIIGVSMLGTVTLLVSSFIIKAVNGTEELTSVWASVIIDGTANIGTEVDANGSALEFIL